MMGGAVKGGQVFGEYPSDLRPGGDLTRRGRVVPTTGWEAVRHALAGWFGVQQDYLSTVLPNLDKHPQGKRIRVSQLFKTM